jgi:hypothetical protein
MGRKILAVILGYAAIALLVVVLDGLVSAVVGTVAKGKGPLFVVSASNLVAGFLAAVGGGIVATAVARHRGPANVLAVLVFLGGVAYAVSQKQAGLPPWYPLGLPVVGAVGAFLGGWVREV